MKFSEQWLRELVDLKVDHDSLLKRLNLTGLEVESVENLGAGLARIVVGEIVSAEPHPDADKLRVCQVSVGTGENFQIVWGDRWHADDQGGDTAWRRIKRHVVFGQRTGT